MTPINRRASAAVYQDGIEPIELTLVKSRIIDSQKKVLSTAHAHILSMLGLFNEEDRPERREELEINMKKNLDQVFNFDQVELELRRIVQDLNKMKK